MKKRAFVRYNKTGEIVPGSLVLSHTWPSGPGLWYEVQTDLCCDPTTTTTTAPPSPTTTTTTTELIPPTTTTTTTGTPPVPITTTSTTVEPPVLLLRFSDLETEPPVADVNDVNDWNTLFDLPNNGGISASSFTSVVVVGDTDVYLYGAQGITLEDNIFAGNSYITEVIDQGVIFDIGSAAFQNCPNLTSVTFINAVNIYASAFEGCTSLASIVLPSVMSIGDLGFYNTALTYVDLPYVTYVGNDAFADCPSLTDVQLISMIACGNTSFAGNPSLNNINFIALETAGDAFLNGCTGLSVIDLPALLSCGSFAFNDCIGVYAFILSSITNLGPTTGDDNVFANISGSTIDLYVPAAIMTADLGSPDGDIANLQANNTVTVNIV